MPRDRVKARKARSGVKERYRAFALEYIANGNNATQAAITAGYSPKSAGITAHKLLKIPYISEIIAAHTEKAVAKLEISADQVLQQAARVAFSDFRKLFREDGTLKDPAEVDDDTAAAVGAFHFDAGYSGQGKKRKAPGGMAKVKLWDKNAAIEKLMRHLGLFERDNVQARPEMNLKIAFLDNRR